MGAHLTRREVRHAILRARNARVLADRDVRWPVLLFMSRDTLADLLIDSDPAERETLDFEAMTFMSSPIIIDPRPAHGDVQLQWPAAKEAHRG